MHALLDLLLDALGRAGVQLVALEQQDRDGVHLEDLRDALEQLVQQLVLVEIGERSVGHALQGLEDLQGQRLWHGPEW